MANLTWPQVYRALSELLNKRCRQELHDLLRDLLELRESYRLTASWDELDELDQIVRMTAKILRAGEMNTGHRWTASLLIRALLHQHATGSPARRETWTALLELWGGAGDRLPEGARETLRNLRLRPLERRKRSIE